MTGLPNLAEVFFDRDGAEDDDTVHADDSCCMSLRWPSFADDVARWAEVLNQHVEAFSLLARQAHDLAMREGEDGEMGGWFIGRPLLFAASHVVELALKTALLDHHVSWPRGAHGHDLAQLLELDRSVHGPRVESAAWEDDLVARLDLAWMAGRFPTTLRGAPLGDDLCCVSALGLLSAIEWMLTLIAAGSPAGVADTSEEQDA